MSPSPLGRSISMMLNCERASSSARCCHVDHVVRGGDNVLQRSDDRRVVVQGGQWLDLRHARPHATSRSDRTARATSKLSVRRDVAQPGSAPALGAGGRRFESGRPDRQKPVAELNAGAINLSTRVASTTRVYPTRVVARTGNRCSQLACRASRVDRRQTEHAPRRDSPRVSPTMAEPVSGLRTH